ncbi:MAG: phosphatase PAP2 family protein [Hyphomicrobiales bacterium]
MPARPLPAAAVPTAFVLGVLGLAVLCLVVLLALFAAWPELDLMVARRFHEMQGGSFGARFDRSLILVRDLGYYLPVALVATAILGWMIGLRRPRLAAMFSGRRVLFLVLSFALGPGLVVNGVLKEVSHRPRPAQLVEFGGASAFRPWYAFDGACERNCSFASGEAAGATWLFAPASLAPPPWRSVAIAGTTIIAVAVAVLRMAFGGHFASDVIGGALVTLLCLLATGWVLRRRGGFGGF